MTPTPRTLLVLTLATPLFSDGDPGLQLLAPGTQSADEFGSAIDSDGVHVLVGANRSEEVGTYAGEAHLFDAATGAWLFELHPDEDYGTYGSSVAIDGPYALVGSPGEQLPGKAHVGAAYLVDVGTGATLVKLELAAGEYGDRFGESVAICGNRALVAAPGLDLTGTIDGAVYVYDLPSGNLVRELLPTPGSEGSFGKAVALDGTLALIGAPNEIVNGVAGPGVVYAIDITTGAVLKKLWRAGATEFGRAVDLDGDRAIIGAPEESTNAFYGGGAYLIETTGFTFLADLTPPDLTGYDEFGHDVAIQGDLAMVGSIYDDDLGAYTGSAYLFDATDGSLEGKLIRTPGVDYGRLGRGVSFVDHRVAISGRDYAVLRDASNPTTHLGAIYCDPAVPNSLGRPGHLRAFGHPSANEQCTWVSAHDLPCCKPAMLIVSQTQGLTTPPGSEGELCLGGAIGRYKDDTQTSSSWDWFSLELDLGAIPTPQGTVKVLPGETWNFQLWYRDGNTSNFTNAVSITYQ